MDIIPRKKAAANDLAGFGLNRSDLGETTLKTRGFLPKNCTEVTRECGKKVATLSFDVL